MNAPELWGGPVGESHAQWDGLRSLIMDPWKTTTSNFTLANLRAAQEELERERRNPRPVTFYMSTSEYEARMTDPDSMYGQLLPPTLDELCAFHSAKLQSIYADVSRAYRLAFMKAGWVNPNVVQAIEDVRIDSFERMMENDILYGAPDVGGIMQSRCCD